MSQPERNPEWNGNIETVQSYLHRLSSIYDSIGDCIFDLSVEAPGKYRFLSVNKAFCVLTGRSMSKILGIRPDELIPEPFLSSILEKYHQAIMTGKIVRWEQTVITESIQLIGDVTVVPVLDDKGICTNLVGSFHDVTERKQAEELLRNSEERWRSFVTKSPDAIVIMGIDGRIEEVSPKSMQMFGYEKAEDGIGKNVIEFIDPAYHEKMISQITEMVGGIESPGADEFLAIKKDGSRFFVEVNSEVIRNCKGEPVSFINIIRDITRRKATENALIESESEYRRLYRMIRLMADTMPDMMWAKDLDKNYIFANKAICENLLNARNTAEPVGKNDIFFARREREAHPDNPGWHTFGELCMDSDDITLKELRKMQFDEFGNINGNFLYLDVHKAPLFNDEGKLIGLVGSARDVTEKIQSEKTITMLAQAILSVSECVSITDMTDRILFVNNAFLKTYQYSKEELNGHPIDIVRSDKNPPELTREILPATLRGGWHGELINRRKDGSEFPVNVSTSVIKDESGNPLGLIGVTTDITDRRRSEQELKESEARNKALLSAMPDLMFMFNRNGDFIDYHARDPKMLFLEPELFMNRNVFEVLPAEIAEETMHHLNEVFEKGVTSVYEYKIQIGNEVGIFESRIVSCGENSALSIVRDVTDQKKLESQIIQTERLAALGEMSAGMAHEINQPLNTLSILFDNILFEARDNHRVSEDYLASKSEKIFGNILRIKNIIDHVREFSRSQEEEILVPFDVNDCITNALSMVSEQYKMAGISMITEFSEQLPSIPGNNYKFERIILNLIINSKDALIEKKTELKASYPMQIRIRTGHDRHNIQVKVEDNGNGIREEIIDKVFQPFYTTKGPGKGTGLGLSISYGLVREMGGNIEIVSKFRKGTTITITVPYKA